MINEAVVEQAARAWLGGIGYEVLSGLTIAPGEPATERADFKQVFLFERLQTKLDDLQEALRKIRLICHPTLVENNRAFHRLRVEGVDVEFRNRDGQIVHDKVWLIDFAEPEANEFLAVNQFTVEEGHFNRHADVVVSKASFIGFTGTPIESGDRNTQAVFGDLAFGMPNNPVEPRATS